MLRTILATVLVLTPLALGTASAAGCPDVADSIYVGAVAMHVTTGPALWHETNHVAGLQTSAGSCTDDNGRDFSWVADTRLI